jgi:hypothetical protein
MAAAIGCRKTCEETNVIDTGQRKDGYKTVCMAMEEEVGHKIERDDIKVAIMTHYYGSILEPILLFGEDTPELKAFYKIMSKTFPGAEEMKNDLLSCIDKQALEYKFIMPDGFTVYYKILVTDTVTITVNGHSFKYSAKVNQANPKHVCLLTAIIHAFDAWIVREMKVRAHQEGFAVLTIHDGMYSSPLHCQRVRELYNELLAELHERNYMQDVLRQVTGDAKLIFNQKEDLTKDILKSNYSLS